jgi:DNA polymerase-4
VGIAVANLESDSVVQRMLPFDRYDELDAVLDELRERFGPKAVTRAVLLGRDTGLSVPLLPD